MTSQKHVILLVALIAVFPRICAAAEVEGSELASQARAVLKQYCHRCHGVGFEVEDLNVLDRKSLDRESSAGIPYVTPGKLAASHLWERVEQGTMPPRKRAGPTH